MKINIGTTNQVKINAVNAALLLYPEIFPNFVTFGINANVPEFGHPKSIDETVAGAIARAKSVFQDCKYSIGIEGGLIQIPHTISGYMETTVCAIFDGQNIYIGLGPAFEWPKKVTEMIFTDNVDASEAFKRLDLTDKAKLGATTGGINGYLTKGRQTREQSITESVIMAMIYIENSQLKY